MTIQSHPSTTPVPLNAVETYTQFPIAYAPKSRKPLPSFTPAAASTWLGCQASAAQHSQSNATPPHSTHMTLPALPLFRLCRSLAACTTVSVGCQEPCMIHTNQTSDLSCCGPQTREAPQTLWRQVPLLQRDQLPARLWRVPCPRVLCQRAWGPALHWQLLLLLPR